jgi:hypothetical protein
MQRFNDPDYSGPSPLHDVSVRVLTGSESAYQLRQHRSLTTPLSIYGKRVNYSILEYHPLLDSAK